MSPPVVPEECPRCGGDCKVKIRFTDVPTWVRAGDEIAAFGLVPVELWCGDCPWDLDTLIRDPVFSMQTGSVVSGELQGEVK